MNQLGDYLPPDSDPLAFLAGGGEMGSLIRAMDWSQSSLGPVAAWPQSLRTTVSICLASDLPICVIWGPGLVQIYNDAYRVICGGKHPRSMGQNFSECWKEAWPVIGKAHDSALAGDKAFLEVQPIFLERHGYVEECFFTFSFSPIRNEAGRVGGLFHPVIEMTAQMLSERRTRALRDLAAQTSKAKSVSEALSLSVQTLAQYNLDLPFTLFYMLEPDGDQARLIEASGLQAETVARLSAVHFGADEPTLWRIEEVVRTGLAVQVDELDQRIGPAGPYPETANAAWVLPIIPLGADRPVAIFIAGISARLPMTEAYRAFYDLLASSITTAVANARAYDDERRRAKALAELDRAKTTFFANVSHEFRTPLTLMLGPIEDALAALNDPLPPLQREQLQIVHRNGLRLQRLVNSLLDFSRIEAGRVRAAYEPTGLADFTAELASNFRSACEKAGLELRVDCPPLDEPVFIDRLMWEKIVLNLLSNAFKFTFDGGITVSLKQADLAVELRVSDTGTGIPAEEMPLLFERFHRVENARGRTHEGSGIGLALVQELVMLHGGSIRAESEVGRGTTFTVLMPLGSHHLPRDQVGSQRSAELPRTTTNPFVEEALRWLPDADQYSAGPAGPADSALPQIQNPLNDLTSSLKRFADDRPLVLVADDNADMRHYIVRLLSQLYRTEAVADGEAALAAVWARLPDLILTDVMMPRLDGFGLLQALRAEPRTRNVPVIMLSARAGEESRIGGMQQGADDYLVKPFSARELLARVTAHLQMARMRRESSAAIQASEEQFRALIRASSDVVYRMNADWTEMRHLHGRELVADTSEPNRSWLEKYIHPDDQRHVLEVIQEAIRTQGVFELEHRALRIDGTLGWAFSRAIPLLDNDGTVVEWFGMAGDVTARKQAQEALGDSEQKFRTLFESMDEGYCVIEMIFDADARPADYRFLEVNPAFETHTGIHNAQGKLMREIAPDHDAYWFEIYGKVAVTGESIRFVQEAKALGDRWFDVYAFRLGGHGSHKVAILFSNISDRKASEDALRASENRSRTILESITDGFFALDRDWRITYINTAGERFLDRTPGDLIGKVLWDEFPGTVGSEFEQVYRRVIAGRVAESFTAHYPHFDSWYETTVYPAPEGLSVYFRDVTKQKHITDLLQTSEERRRLALDAAELGTWNMQPTTRVIQTDARFQAIFGTIAKFPDLSQLFAIIHPDDVSAVQQALAAATRLDDPTPYAMEYRIIHSDGSLRWVSAKGRSSFEGTGPTKRVTSFDGTVADITDRKRSEDALRASENRSQTILDRITDGFFALDTDWRFTYMNAAGERSINCTPGYLIGKCFWDEYPGTVGSEFDRFYRRVAASRVSESLTAHSPDNDHWYEVTAYPTPEGLSVYFRDISDRRQVEQERQQFAALMEASSDFIGVAGLDQRCTYLNRAGEKLIGLDPGQASSISMLDCFPKSEHDRVTGLMADSEGGDHVIADTWFQHLQTGELIPVSWSFLRLRDESGNVSGYATVTRDLTERCKAEELLRASEERRRLALEAAELGTWHVEPVTRATTTDARYKVIFGTTEAWTDYFQAYAVIHPDDLPAVKAAVAAATRLDNPIPYAIEYRIKHSDGSQHWVFAKGRSTFEGVGSTLRVASFDGTVADITDRKRGEEEREQLVTRLQEQDQRKDEFLATLAHELRNPLAPIRNGLRIMRLAKDDPDKTEQIRSMMERQVGQMVHLIDDLLDLSRINQGKINLRKERIELASAITQAIETSRPSITQAHHELVIAVPPDPIYVDADLTRLTQVFSNLLNNAAKFTQRGGQLRLAVQQAGDEAVVSVSDNGVGIPSNMLSHIFDMFTQVDGNRGQSQEGLGIGLSIVQRLVQMHGGSVEARSDGPGKGSEFVVRLPLAVSLLPNQPAVETSLTHPGTHLRILVADDNRDSAESLAMLLTLEGNETRTAHDGLETLEVAAAFRPDVILLDLGMPKLNGFEVCRSIRQQAWGKHMVVVALTGWGQEEDKRRSLAAGFDAHLVKPIDIAHLEKLLTGVTATRA